jgi:hypothetical protein
MYRKMLVVKNVLISTTITSILVASIVWVNAPLEATPYTRGKSVAVFGKAFLISFLVMFVFFYFTNTTGTDEVIENIIKGKPDF